MSRIADIASVGLREPVFDGVATGAAAAAGDATLPQSDTPFARLQTDSSPQGFDDWACQIPLPADVGDISCLKWHPLRHLLAAGTWGGQVLIWEVTDVFTRGERPFNTHVVRDESARAADIRAKLLHAVPVGVPVLSVAWRPCSAGDDLQDVLAVCGASSSMGLLFAEEGVLVPVATLTRPDAGGREVSGGVFGVGWLSCQLSAFEGSGAVRAANSDPVAGEALCTPLVCATYDNTLHSTYGITGKLLAAMRAVMSERPGDTGALQDVLTKHGVTTEAAHSQIAGKYTSLDTAGPLAYLGVAVPILHRTSATPTFLPCRVQVLCPEAGGKLKHVADLDTSLKVCINGVVAHPRRWGSVTSYGAESRTNVHHVGAASRQKFTYKCHRADGPRREGNKIAHVPTALCWLQPAASDFLARLYYRRPHHEGAPDACVDLSRSETFSELSIYGDPVSRMSAIGTMIDTEAVSTEISPQEAATQDGQSQLAANTSWNLVPPAVPSPYYKYLLGRSCRYIANVDLRKNIMAGPLCVSAATDGSVIFWDVDKRMRNLLTHLLVEHEDVFRRVCATHVACDSTGSFLAIASGPSWSRGDPEREGQTAAVSDEICSDKHAPSHLVVFPICDFMTQK